VFLLQALARLETPHAQIAVRLAEAGTARGLAPNKDFGLGGFAFTHDMVHGASEAIFAIARMAGWLAHGLESRQAGTTRARARYVGPAPDRSQDTATTSRR
jgi:citrate synthase